MEEIAKMEIHLQSAAAFVEGGIQDACDDSCSICLEAFCDSDPSAVTTCKHEFHLQCILEWCQRSSQCPMCWQRISLKDPANQELLVAVEREKEFRANQSRNTTIFHHPTLGEFELQHLPVGASDDDIEERILQHLAAAAARGRSNHSAIRGLRGRPASQSRPQFLVFSRQPNTHSMSSSSGENESISSTLTAGSSVFAAVEGQHEQQASLALPNEAGGVVILQSGNSSPNSPVFISPYSIRGNRSSSGQSTPITQDRAGPSDFHSFSESLKSRFNAVSMRYKESISKSTRGWKERFFSRSASVADMRSDVKREVTAGIASMSRMIERLDMRENSSTPTSAPSSHEVLRPSVVGSTSDRIEDGHHFNALSNDASASTSFATSSGTS
ncbi:E3 ubiquitin-protein ligase RHF2A [Apostasia shenzhenica]|uniref:RING-type E3 ubiquitin transferase n=1 Tax=Apostasia shenzhenica TaxID=1088818 RepID=A0A2I0A5S2_9ASPA|nr:E3 ubiquitin-protein ligase RHF2A [Apostasia shenzhenica]